VALYTSQTQTLTKMSMKRALPSAFLYRKVPGLELRRVACLLTLLSPLGIRGGGDNLKHSSLYALFGTIHAE
jgi:hypothetical protein